MNSPDRYFLQPYQNNDIVLRLKAWAALIFDLSVIFTVVIMGTFFAAHGIKDPGILYPFTGTIFSAIISLALLRKGKFQFAANLSFASVQIALWLVIFFESGPLLQRMDSIVLISVSLAYTPLLFVDRRRGIWFYYTANMLLLIIFVLYVHAALGLERWEVIEYFMDSALALTFITAISYQIFSIHKLGIINAYKAQNKIQKQYEELSATAEELEAMNEELTAINEELENTQQELLTSNSNLQKETAQLQTILSSITDGIITTDDKGTITSINYAALKLFGFKDDVIGKQFASCCILYNAKTGIPYEDPVTQVLQQGKPVSLYRNTIIRNNGDTYYAYIVCNPLYIANKIAGCIIVIRNITDLVHYEDEMVKTAKYESLSIFAGGIAHDFNNMLSAILGNISIIEHLTQNDKIINAAGRAQKAIFKARDLTTQLLAFSKGGAPVKTSASLVNIIKDTAEFVLSGSAIQCRFIISDDLHNALIDPAQISQVIHNIILNARQAIGQQGTITITANNVVVNDPSLPISGEFIEITIHNTGEGIPPDIMPYIFDPFFTTRKDGHGLGLSIVYSIIKRHDGHVTVESSNEGTCFTLYLPKAELIQKKAAQQHDSIYSTPSLYIVIMDDDEMVTESLREMLSLQGCDVMTVRDGDAAVKVASQAVKQNKPFDIAILDLTIKGGKGGVDSIRELKAILPNCKFIASTGYTNEAILSNFKEYGFDAILPKPYTFNELIKVLSSLINNQ
ncbi:MAG TPA: ATP-binding protein [Spirochaetota bacterium]|nr:ATP-binding protein [Spirochaetota bacterium]